MEIGGKEIHPVAFGYHPGADGINLGGVAGEVVVLMEHGSH